MITEELKSKLEKAFAKFRVDKSNPTVLSKLTDHSNDVNVYLIAKYPNNETYIGIIESSLTKNEIAEFPLENIVQLVSTEVVIEPFPASDLLNKKPQPFFIPKYKQEDIIPSELQKKYGITMGDHMIIHAVLKILIRDYREEDSFVEFEIVKNILKEYGKVLSDEKVQSIINFFNEYYDEEVFHVVYHSSIGVKFLATDLDKEDLIEIQQDYSRKSAF